MALKTDVRAATAARPVPRPASPVALITKIVLLGLMVALALAAAFPLIGQGRWLLLALLAGATALLLWVYLSRRRIPAKYLIPGTLFLVAFQIFPVLYTMTTAFTNFGDGHRGSKAEAIRSIEGASVQQVADSVEYVLTIATKDGDLVFLLVDPASRAVQAGTKDGLSAVPAGDVQVDGAGKVVRAEGYQPLSIIEADARGAEIEAFSVPTARGAIRGQGLSGAFEGVPRQRYDQGCDCVRDTRDGHTWTADDSRGYFADGTGATLAQGWKVQVGLRNFADVLSNPLIAKYFLRILLWNFAFALLTVLITFALGLAVAIVLNTDRLRGQRLYRSLLILPYAMPGFAMLLLWRDMFNTDFGLVNRLFGVHVNWFGTSWSSMTAILLVQLWMGYPYMFLVCTGALQAIPGDLKEAAAVDGAKPFYAFRTVTFPLLLVAMAPLLIASFAFNFNNFGAIYFVSEGGPFPADNPNAGATDLLITYTYRIAFGGQGAQYGLAAAISVFIFLIVAVVSIAGFRRTHVLEEVNR
ncbi:ABC transporter permease subunit [Dactylosporangium sp. CS-047395]|uniref:ABC transporter permease subunit n=1 Tax=Dactylosporangium sp. CS-047395 TaxID=3239936 RepID=UPI003D8A388F